MADMIYIFQCTELKLISIKNFKVFLGLFFELWPIEAYVTQESHCEIKG